MSSVISAKPPLVANQDVPLFVSILTSPVSNAKTPFLCLCITPKDPSTPGHLRYLTLSSLITFIGVTISIEIVTPIKVINEESVKYLRCPGVDGSFGVMHKHRNGVFALETGEVKIETNNGTSWFATSGGFAEITEDKVELLLESIEKSNEIDVKRATEALERAKARKKNIDDNVDTTRLEASLSRALNRLKVSKK